MKLKNIVHGLLLLVAAFITGVRSGYAQPSLPSLPVRLGLEAGGSLSDIRYDPNKISVNENGIHPGFIGGAFLQLNLSSSFALQPEVLYVQKGTHDVSFTAEFDYVEVPVLLKYYLPGVGVSPNLFIGGSVAFNVSAQNNPDNGGAPFKWNSNDVSSTEENLIVGVGVDFDKFSVSGRYEMGLSDVTTSNYGPNSFQNEIFNVMVGYSFL